MANEKIIKSRQQQKHDVEANWLIAGQKGFIPKAGEIIVYDKDENNNKVRIKIGDDTTKVHELSFIVADAEDSVGKATENGGEIFNDYENNIASKFGHAEGFKTNAGHTGHAEGDHTEASWRSHAEGYHTHAKNTAHAGGRLSIATGKGSFAQGLGRPIDVKVNNVQVKTTEKILLTSNIVPLDTDIRSELKIGDFVYLFLTDADGNKIIEPTDSKRIEQISEDGKTLTLSDCFLAFNYDETYVPTPEDGGEPVIPMGAGLRKDVPCQALGEGSIAVGKGVIASGAGSSARGMDTVSSGLYSHAEGNGSTASGQTSHAEGRSTTASGVYSHSEGNKSLATEEGAHAEGTNTQASAPYSHSEGHYTKAKGLYSHAEGGSAIAEGTFSHAEGYHTHAKGSYQHVQGKYNIIDNYNEYAHIVGNGNADIPSNAYTLDWAGQGWFKKDLKIGGSGYFDLENAKKVLTEDDLNGYVKEDSLSDYLTEEDIEGFITAENLTDYAQKADLIGQKTAENGEIFNDYSTNTAANQYAHAEGQGCNADGYASHAEGRLTKALSFYTHAEGKSTIANAEGAHAEGQGCNVEGKYSHAEGWGNEITSKGEYSHAEGVSTKADGTAVHVEGYKTKASGPYSHAEGHGTIAQGTAQHVQGKWNEALSGTYLHIIGNGSSDTERSNCHTIDQKGNAWFAGKVTAGADPTGNMDLVTLRYLNSKLGDIDTALDGIIDMQKALIGGASV